MCVCVCVCVCVCGFILLLRHVCFFNIFYSVLIGKMVAGMYEYIIQLSVNNNKSLIYIVVNLPKALTSINVFSSANEYELA